MSSRLDKLPGGSSPRRAGYLALLVSNVISLAGSALALLALPWLVLTTTHNAGLAGLVVGSIALPNVIGAVFGGPWVDRFGLRRASVASDLVSAAVFAAIPLLAWHGGLPIGALVGLVLAGGVAETFGVTARRAMVPELAREAGLSLERANSGVQSMQRVATLAGAGIGGLLIKLVGANGALLVDAATFTVSAALVGVLVTRGAPRASTARYLADLRDGVRWVLSDQALSALVLVTVLSNFLDGPLLSVLLPVYANRDLHSSVALGLLIGTFGAAALVGVLLYSWLHRWLPRRLTMIASFTLVGLPFWVLATLPPLPVALTALAISGLVAGPNNPIAATIMQERVPAPLRGRVFGVMTGAALAALPAGMLLAGYAVSWIGLSGAIAVVAGGYLLPPLILVLRSASFSTPPPAPDSAPAVPPPPPVPGPARPPRGVFQRAHPGRSGQE